MHDVIGVKYCTVPTCILVEGTLNKTECKKKKRTAKTASILLL